ncbi:MAG: TonB family protein [Candidatus Accumulibacter sp. UW26]
MTLFFSAGAEWTRHRRLFAALLASLLLHLLLWSLHRPVLPSAGSQGVLAAVLLPGEADAAAPTRPGDEPLSRSDQAPPVDDPARAQRQTGSPSAALLLTALGERRLVAQVPDYLATVLDVPSGSWYFSPAELTVAPLLQEAPLIEAPENPDSANAGVGKVLLRVLVAADGAVDRVELESSDLPAAFADAAVAAFARLRFRPGEIDGVAVSSERRFEVRFDGRESGRSHSTGDAGVR